MTALTIGSLCSGLGGLDLAAVEVFGGRLAWWADIDPAAVAVMTAYHPHAPNLGDVRTVEWRSVPPVHVLTAGYPCQPFSHAGRRLGTEDPRHLWPWIARAIRVLRPRVIVLENVAGHLRRGADVVFADLADAGYLFAWAVVSAGDVGAPHVRRRLFVVAADPARDVPRGRLVGGPPGRAQPSDGGSALGGGLDWGKYSDAVRGWEHVLGRVAPVPSFETERGTYLLTAPFVEWLMGLAPGYVADMPGLSRAQKLRLLGNGVVPQQAALAVRLLLPQLASAQPA
ncbi:DNA cytosine methyltransferase [Amycolatopsis sp. NPDC051071]|uniref:DNA cytosine methyltransferase n=1 Tax=Amycolatopsis sp. NPDC051071 TaxID=3154637 RepID=UPI00342450F6